MKTMIKDIKPIKVKKNVIKFDKNDKKITKTVLEDAYLVTMLNGNSIALSLKQMDELNIDVDGSRKDSSVDYEDIEDDNIIEEDDSVVESSPKFTTNIQKNQEEVISSTDNSNNNGE